MEALSRILPGLMKQLGLEERAAGWRAVSEWPALVGEGIAKHAHASAFHDGVLTVEVDGSAWMQELSLMKRELVRRANQHLGVGVVREVRLVRVRGGSQR